MAESETKKFRISSTRFMLTYKTHVDKKKLIDYLNGMYETSFIRAAHESADEGHPYEHTHVLIEWKILHNVKDSRWADYEGIHPNLTPSKCKKHFNTQKQYIAKEDPENKDLLYQKSFAEEVWECKNIQEALTKASAGQITATVVCWNQRPIKNTPTPEPTWRPWQEKLLKRLEEKPDRRIPWIFDEKGNSGKTFLAREMIKRGAMLITQMGGARDCATIVHNSLRDGWDGKLCIIDLPRQCQDKAIYEPIEMIKNGIMTTTKYSGQTKVWDAGHVVVMANWPPKPFQWSDDRYEVWDLRK